MIRRYVQGTHMNPKTLSAVIEKQIRKLCLTDFPCGNGSWSRTRDGSDGAETESAEDLVDLLSFPRSPWTHGDESWSPQASELRKLAVRDPRRLNTKFIHKYITTLRIIGKDVSTIDSGLLRFSKLQELVLSANMISDIPPENLPSTLKILELRANRLSSLSSLTNHPPPQLQYLGLGSNNLGSHKDVSHLTGRSWPQLVCLDLSDCDFQDQQILLTALKTLPCLKTLTLNGNPFTLEPSYPGFTVDSLPQLLCLDSLWISCEKRRQYHGLAQMNDLIEDVASVTVSLSRLRGIPDPQMTLDKNTPEFPVVTYRYFISYQFLSHHASDDLGVDSESNVDTTSHITDIDSFCSDRQSDRNPKASSLHATLNTDETLCGPGHLSQHRTSKLIWSECMELELRYTQTFTISSLRDLKKFFIQGLCLSLEEEKILSWPAASEDTSPVKASSTTKGKKGKKEAHVNSVSSKDKAKDKKSKCAPELVEEPPVRRLLSSVHIPLQSLVQGSQSVTAVCDFGPMQAAPEVEAALTLKDPVKKTKADKKNEKESKQKTLTSEKAGRDKETKACDTDEEGDPSVLVQQETVTVELCVELEKWKNAPEAHHALKPAQNILISKVN